MRTVIVPLDGSGFAEQALPAAIDIAARTGSTLNVVTVHDAGTVGAGPYAAPFLGDEFDAATRTAMREYVEQTASRLAASGAGIPADATVLVGQPGTAIARHAEASAPALIVMTTHGRRGPNRWWLGSVATDLARRAHVPLLTIRTAEEGDAHRIRGEFRRIVIALDGTPAAETAIATTLEIAGRENVEFILLRVVPQLHRFQRIAQFAEEYEREIAEASARAERYLEEVASRNVFAGATVLRNVRVHEHEATAIVEFAEQIGADLIAAGAHSRSGVERFLLGSVADRVLRTASVPVLLTRTAPPAAERGAGASAQDERHEAASEAADSAPATRAPRLARVVVGVDFAEPSVAAAKWVSEQFVGADTILVHGVYVPPPPTFSVASTTGREQFIETARRGAEERLAGLVASLQNATARGVVRVGEPAATLTSAAQEFAADLIVVGDRGERTGIARLLGGTADRVLRTASSPVLLARGLAPRPPRHVVVALDDSPVAGAVVNWARVLCERFRATVTVLHVLSPALLGTLGPAPGRGGRRALRGAADQWLSTHANQLRAAGLTVTTTTVHGEPSARILAVAKRAKADVIVVGRRLAWRAGRAVFGSIADRVVRSAPTSVLVVPGR